MFNLISDRFVPIKRGGYIFDRDVRGTYNNIVQARIALVKEKNKFLTDLDKYVKNYTDLNIIKANWDTEEPFYEIHYNDCKTTIEVVKSESV